MKTFVCNICLCDNVKPYVLYPCSHNFCEPCAKKLTSCAICRTNIVGYMFNREFSDYVYKDASTNSSNFKKLYQKNEFNPSHEEETKLINEFKNNYEANIITQSDIQIILKFIKAKKYTKSDFSSEQLKSIFDKLVSGKYMTSIYYKMILDEIKGIYQDRGNEVWQITYSYIIDFWNIKWDGMDSCFNECTKIYNLTPTCAGDIHYILNSSIPKLKSCCNVKSLIEQKS